LKQVADRLAAIVPANCFSARLGGDEFVVLCPPESDCDPQLLAGAIVEGFRLPFKVAGKPYRTSVSVGLASSAEADVSELTRAADAAMYAAKRRGGNQSANFARPLHEELLSRHQLEQDLFAAIERGEFELHYQPIVAFADRSVQAYEALVRWHHPIRGRVGPDEFIRAAEETGMILALGDWVLRTALHDLHSWRLPSQPSLCVSVNVSAVQLAREDFAQSVLLALDEADVPSSALILEVTESVLTSEGAVAQIARLRLAGVRIAIDDFGTGYSSLAYLQRLPVDKVKIDKSFLSDLGSNERQVAFVGAIVQLARTIGLQVVAEGVETEQQWSILRSLGCDEAQGFLLGRPSHKVLSDYSPDERRRRARSGKHVLRPIFPRRQVRTRHALAD